MNLHFIAASDILKYLLIPFNPFNDNSVRVPTLHLSTPYLYYVLLLNPILFDKVLIDLIELAVLAAGNRRPLCQRRLPLVYPDLELARLTLQVHRHQVQSSLR